MIDLLLLLLLFAGGTWLAGWWAILVIAAGWGWLRWNQPAWRAALAAAVVWAAFLAVAGPALTMVKLLDRLGRIFPAPGPALVLLTIAYAGILAWAAARLMQGVRKSRSG